MLEITVKITSVQPKLRAVHTLYAHLRSHMDTFLALTHMHMDMCRDTWRHRLSVSPPRHLAIVHTPL